MGEVFKGRDTRVDRDVAIKVSSKQISDGLSARFGKILAVLFRPGARHRSGDQGGPVAAGGSRLALLPAAE